MNKPLYVFAYVCVFLTARKPNFLNHLPLWETLVPATYQSNLNERQEFFVAFPCLSGLFSQFSFSMVICFKQYSILTELIIKSGHRKEFLS